MSATADIRAALRAGRKLTALNALRQFGTMRLAAIVYDLRREGLPISSERVTVKTLRGNSRVACYWMPKE